MKDDLFHQFSLLLYIFWEVGKYTLWTLWEWKRATETFASTASAVVRPQKDREMIWKSCAAPLRSRQALAWKEEENLEMSTEKILKIIRYLSRGVISSAFQTCSWFPLLEIRLRRFPNKARTKLLWSIQTSRGEFGWGVNLIPCGGALSVWA